MRKNKVAFIFIFICISNLIFAEIKGAIYSIYEEKQSDKVISLNGEWEFYVNKLITTNSDGAYIPDTYIDVPSSWNETVEKFGLTKYSANTYRMLIVGLKKESRYGMYIKDSPGTSCKIYCNGVYVDEIGRVDMDLSKAQPKAKPIYEEFSSDNQGQIELIIQVCNSTYRKGGIWDAVRFGSAYSIFREFCFATGLRFFIIFAVLVLAFVNFIIFLVDHSKKSEWLFAWFLFFFDIRVATAEFSMIALIFKPLPFAIQYKLEYVGLWLSIIFFILFYYNIKTSKTRYFLGISVIALNFLIGIISTVLPINHSSYLVTYILLCGSVGVVYILSCAVIDWLHHDTHGLVTLIDGAILLTGLIPDYIMTYKLDFLPIRLTPYAVLLFAIFQFSWISWEQSQLYKKYKQLVGDLQKLNEASVRFVPREFLRILNVKDLLKDIKLGNHVDVEMTIIFSQLYFEQYEGCNPNIVEDRTVVLSEFLKKVSPKIISNKGFISKFISQGFMALFPKEPSDAINFCRTIVVTLDEINQKRREECLPLLKIGIGVHYGKMILGMIGEESRLDDTVISDTVNTASRIESYAEKQKLSIVVSDVVVKHTKPTDFTYTPLGVIKIKDKELPLQLSEFKF